MPHVCQVEEPRYSIHLGVLTSEPVFFILFYFILFLICSEFCHTLK